MITIGRTIRWYNNYIDEVNFCKENGFDFMQIWFKDGQIVLDSIPEPKIEYIKKIGFPVIFHAVFTPTDIDLYGDALLDMVKKYVHLTQAKTVVNFSNYSPLDNLK
ncbi:MAG: hypothetical protein SO436_03850 [Oscillospiraceae bacterium]|nr:hypothetical protein [Oscillospiraceae bacterium]MDD6983303.1 hypothetical protein [Oscillospiraceae bacterium]MDY4623606.1 hypothetical protein [Oscillospiraceae bacterium]